MKRFRIGNEEIEVDMNLAHVLMSISRSHSGSYPYSYPYSYRNNSSSTFASIINNTNQSCLYSNNTSTTNTNTNRMFECKTCNRQFPSFQALGGHRASHKRPKVTPGHCGEVRIEPPTKAAPRVHSCPICGLRFTIGQALGGHMRRHRAIGDNGGVALEQQENKTLCLDLNLAPPGTTTQWRNNIVHRVSGTVDCFL